MRLQQAPSQKYRNIDDDDMPEMLDDEPGSQAIPSMQSMKQIDKFDDIVGIVDDDNSDNEDDVIVIQDDERNNTNKIDNQMDASLAFDFSNQDDINPINMNQSDQGQISNMKSNNQGNGAQGN